MFHPAFLLLCLGVVLLASAINTTRPLRWPGAISLFSWAAGWLTGELLTHHAIWQVLAVVVLGALGALHRTSGEVGLLLVLVSWGLFYRIWRQGYQVGRVLEGALREGLGESYETRLAEGHGSMKIEWWKVLRILPLTGREVEVRRNIEFARYEKKRLSLDVYRKRGSTGRHPTLIYVHGGGWVMGNKELQGRLTVDQLARAGWVCISISYRLSPRATFPEHLIDVKQAIRWVKEHGAEYGCDPDFIVLSGGSAGAHLASLAALTPNDPAYQPGFEEVDTRVQGCVGYYGVYDFTDREKQWPHRAFRLLLRWVIMKRVFSRDRAAYERASPVYQVAADAPPFLLIHGDQDSLAPVGEARAFARTLRATSQAPVVYAELPGAQHAFEIFPSVRSTQTVQMVERFLEYIYRSRPPAA
jgi:acetyl esterase/lipase